MMRAEVAVSTAGGAESAIEGRAVHFGGNASIASIMLRSPRPLASVTAELKRRVGEPFVAGLAPRITADLPRHPRMCMSARNGSFSPAIPFGGDTRIGRVHREAGQHCESSCEDRPGPHGLGNLADARRDDRPVCGEIGFAMLGGWTNIGGRSRLQILLATKCGPAGSKPSEFGRDDVGGLLNALD